MGQSIGIGSVSAISDLKCIGIGSVVKKWYRCITRANKHIAFDLKTFVDKGLHRKLKNCINK